MRRRLSSSHILRVRCLQACMLLGLLPAKFSSAQNTVPVPDPDDSQLWTSVQFGLPLRERTQLILSGSFRQGRDFSHPVYEAGGAGARFQFGRYFALSPICQFVATQYYPRVHTRENRLSINGVVSVPIKRLVLDNMHQFEQRFRELQNSNRYRTRVQVEWPFRFHDADYRLFSWDEVYYDWNYHAWNRNRFAVGGGKRLNSKLAMDLFFLKQNARFSRPRDINGIGVTFRIQLDRPIHHLP
ncbi:MAG: DUF2490 domain-containing protein [Acidobacteria bacterium]|nr:DUF2490 domain-containing protein [Acidobacteriota bacterium]